MELVQGLYVGFIPGLVATFRFGNSLLTDGADRCNDVCHGDKLFTMEEEEESSSAAAE